MAVKESVKGVAIPTGRLWFGLAGSIAAWLSLGFLDILITWRACVHEEQFGAASSQSGARTIYIVVAVVLFLVVIAAGVTSYRNWRAISAQRAFVNATATDRHEFMALLCVFISATLGFGVLWLAIPPLLIELCARAR